MTIVDKIKATIQAAVEADYGQTDINGDPVMESIDVWYHDEPTLNVLTSRMRFPCVMFQLLTNGRVVQEGGQVKEAVTAAVFFVDKTEFDFDGEDNEVIIDQCKARAFTWLSWLSSSELVGIEAVNRTTRVYDRYDDILTGFGVSVDLKEINGLCV